MQKVLYKSACLIVVVLLLLGSASGCASQQANAPAPEAKSQKTYDSTNEWGFEVKAISAHSIGLTWNPGRLLTGGPFELQVLDRDLHDTWKTLADVTRGDHFIRLDKDVEHIPTAKGPILLHQNLESSAAYIYRIISSTNNAVVSPVVATSTPHDPPEGVYVGILSFAGTVEPITKELIHLDLAGKKKIMNSLDSLHTLPDSGSALYYAVHQALTNIDIGQWESKLPDRINSTTLITFTDGLDTGSTNTANLPSLKADPAEGIWSAVRDFKKPGLSAEVNRTSIKEYSRYIKDRLRVPNLHAFSIGVQSPDAANVAAFQETVHSLISPTGGAYLLDNYRQLEPQLAKIVDSQLQVFSTPRFTFSMFTPVYPDETKIRLTFDGKSPTASTKFIDARLARGAFAGELVEMVGRNVRLAGESAERAYPPVEGFPEGKTEFRFTITLNEEIDPKNVQQWYIQQTGGVQSWVRNSEHERIIIDNYTFEYEDEKKSNVIYLVLDASASTANDMEKIRNAAKQYIEKLYAEIEGIPMASAPFSSGTLPFKDAPKPVSPVELDLTLVKPVPPVEQNLPLAKPVARPATTYDPAPCPMYWVQVGAYRENKNTNEAFRILQSKGYKARIVEAPRQSLRYVQAGPFETKAQADKARQNLRTTPGWFSDCYVYRG